MRAWKGMHCSKSCRIVSTLAAAVVVGTGAWAFLRTGTVEAKEPLGRNWPPAQQVAMDDVDHSTFDALLKKYVDEDGFVDYRAWHASAQDRRALRSYLDQLSRASRRARAGKAARLAFWINAYNAVTLEGILQVYPTDSIRNHTAKVVGYNIWEDLPLRVGGREYSLEAMEHQILRKMGEPRIHFAIVCASVGCPRLRNEAYVAEKLDEQLADNARDFFSRSRNLRVDPRSNTLYLSAILDWFGKDFGDSRAARLASLAKYMPAPARQVATSGRARVKFLDYDWSLNDQSRKPRTAARR